MPAALRGHDLDGIPLVPYERGDFNLGLLRPMMHEHAFAADERRPAVGRPDQHPIADRRASAVVAIDEARTDSGH